MGTAQRSATEASRKAFSGAQWVNRFRGSNSLRDLKRSFQDKADAFIDALQIAGAKVSISATYRPPERAYLMHWSWLIVMRDLDPANVPAMDGTAIPSYCRLWDRYEYSLDRHAHDR